MNNNAYLYINMHYFFIIYNFKLHNYYNTYKNIIYYENIYKNKNKFINIYIFIYIYLFIFVNKYTF